MGVNRPEGPHICNILSVRPSVRVRVRVRKPRSAVGPGGSYGELARLRGGVGGLAPPPGVTTVSPTQHGALACRAGVGWGWVVNTRLHVKKKKACGLHDPQHGELARNGAVWGGGGACPPPRRHHSVSARQAAAGCGGLAPHSATTVRPTAAWCGLRRAGRVAAPSVRRQSCPLPHLATPHTAAYPLRTEHRGAFTPWRATQKARRTRQAAKAAASSTASAAVGVATYALARLGPWVLR